MNKRLTVAQEGAAFLLVAIVGIGGIVALGSLLAVLFDGAVDPEDGPAAYRVGDWSDVSTVPNPRETHGGWVSDPGEALGPITRGKIEGRLGRLNHATGAEVTLVIRSSTGSTSPRAFATALFNLWGVGQRGIDNGVLILHVLDQRRLEIETGYGVEGVLPDAVCSRILHEDVVPRLQEGAFDLAHELLIDRVAQVLDGGLEDVEAPGAATWVQRARPVWVQQASAGLRGPARPMNTHAWLVVVLGAAVATAFAWTVLGVLRQLPHQPRKAYARLAARPSQALVVAMAFVGVALVRLLFSFGLRGGALGASLAMCASVVALAVLHKTGIAHTPDYRQRRLGARVLVVFGGLVLVCGFVWTLLVDRAVAYRTFLVAASAYLATLVAWTVVLRLRIRARRHPRRCSRCDATMRRLDGAEANPFMDAERRRVEEIGSRDYDVWVCPAEHVDLEEYVGHLHRRFDDCPECSLPAYKRTESRVVEPPTYASTGLANDTYRCEVCESESVQERVVPRKVRRTSSSRSSSSGGGSSSGSSSFGGGSSGGGGAGASY